MSVIFDQMNLFARQVESSPARKARQLVAPLGVVEELRNFKEYGRETIEERVQPAGGAPVPVFINEFWTARQRQAHSLHEISYRACFKPQLPRFFVERFTKAGEVVYDPFMGRGTTLLEAALLGRKPVGNDVNPLSRMLVGPRLSPPPLEEVERRLEKISLVTKSAGPEELLVFYHPETLLQLMALREYFLERSAEGKFDNVDGWIRMVALNRLTGHSNGFFSVYTLPPNQAVSVKSQAKINLDRKQVPPRREVAKLILKKSRQLLKGLDEVTREELGGCKPELFTGSAAETKGLATGSVSLVVTSPPFLDVVDYATDNWLRCWFAGIDAREVRLTVPKRLEEWEQAMTEVFVELERVLKPGGHIAFEVGEVRKGSVRLEEAVLRCGRAAGLEARFVLINAQAFTKTANCWGVANNAKGTNTNRIVVFQKASG